MNLNKIVKSLEELDRERKIINQKFSSKSKENYVYKSCLREDQIEELRVYGYTHSDTINKFKQRHRETAPERKSETNIASSCIIRDKSDRNLSTRCVTRSQTAHHRPVSKRPVSHKLDFFSRTNELPFKKLSKTTASLFQQPFVSIQLENRKQNVRKNNNFIRKQSIMKFKKQFNQNYEDNLNIAKILISPQGPKHKSKTVIIDNVNELNGQQTTAVNSDMDFFELTQNKNENAKSMHKILAKNPSLSIQIQILNKLNLIIFDNYSTYFLGKYRRIGQKNWNQFWRVIQQIEGSQKFKYYLISSTNLTLKEINYYQLSELHLLIQFLLKSEEKFLHFCIIKEEGLDIKLVYEQFIITPNFTLKHIEWPTWLLRYYFRRFIQISQEYKNIQFIIEQQNKFYQNYNKLSKNIYRFVHELKSKSYVMIDHRGNKLSGNLGQILEQGYKQMETRRMNWNRKGIKFSKDNKQYRVKKQIYFYICSFLLKFYHPIKYTLKHITDFEIKYYKQR